MNIPENVNKLITMLERRGFEAYAVGGCVRDSIMGRTPKDWDICTSAEPSRVKEVFSDLKILETGIKHATLTVMLEGEGFEITTFRIDGAYSDFRRPDKVEFTKDIVCDLARRDFTVNAMAFNPSRGLIDPFGGRRDIENKILRAVGDPGRRFEEDALRIMRALRFCVSTSFDVEKNTAAAMIEKRGLLKNISSERIRDELLKTITAGEICSAFTRFRDIVGEVIPQMKQCFDFKQATKHHCYDVYTHILKAVDSCPSFDPIVKTALLLHDIGKPACHKLQNGASHFKGHPVAGMKMSEEILWGLKFDKASIEQIKTLIQFHDVRLNGGMAQMLKLINLIGEEGVERLLCVMRSDVCAQSLYKREEKRELIERGEENLKRAARGNMCRSLKELALDGNDAVEMGFEGRRVGAALHLALNGVFNEEVKNTGEDLRRYIDKRTRIWHNNSMKEKIL